MQERVQKIIAAAGIMSRRAAEEILLEGRVRVNGAVVTELGTKADPEKDHIKVDGKLINPVQPRAYILLNKPVGYVTTMSDPEGRPVVNDLLKGVKARVYPVGRLDFNTEGLLLLTSDGDFAHLITHPKHELPKTYLVKIKGALDDREVESLERGVFLKDGKTAPAKVKKLRKEEANSWVEITIHEGRKRQVRRMIDHTGHSVIKLKRVRIGTLSLGDQPIGTYRHLTTDEVKNLREAALREPKAPVTLPRTEERISRSAGDPSKKRLAQKKERKPAPELEQRAFDAWAAETGKRRRRERAGRPGPSAPKRYDRDASSLSAGDKKPAYGDRGKSAFSRGPRQDSERSGSKPLWDKKPSYGDRGKSTFSRGPRQDSERSSAKPAWGKKPSFGDRGKSTFSRGPRQDSERSSAKPAWGKKPGFGDRGKGTFSRGPRQDSERSGAKPAWGKKNPGQGAGAFPRTGGPRKSGTGPRGPRGASDRKPRGRRE